MLKCQRALRDRVPNVERLAGRERKRRRGDVVSGAAQRNDDRQMVYSPSDVVSPVGSGRTRRVRGEPRWRRRGFCWAAAAKRFAVVLHDIDADRRGEADTLTTSGDFENHVMDGFAALNRYIVERSPHHRFQPNAGPMTADPDAAARRRSYAVAYRLCFHAPENTAPNRKRSRTNEEPRWRRRGSFLTRGWRGTHPDAFCSL